MLVTSYLIVVALLTTMIGVVRPSVSAILWATSDTGNHDPLAPFCVFLVCGFYVAAAIGVVGFSRYLFEHTKISR